MMRNRRKLADAAQQDQLAEAARGYLCTRQLLSNCSPETDIAEASVEGSGDVSLVERQEIQVQGRISETISSEGIGADIALDVEVEVEPITETLSISDTSSISGSLLFKRYCYTNRDRCTDRDRCTIGDCDDNRDCHTDRNSYRTDRRRCRNSDCCTRSI